jgi:riboflavin biosynthesis pyrimidine reductase
MNGLLQPLTLLYEDDVDRTDLPEPLMTCYGGPLRLSGRRLVTNFVATLDGVVAMPTVPESNRVISGDSEGDRFVMGLLRAYADVVLVGSGTLHGSPRTLWTAEDAYPVGEPAYADWRKDRGLPPAPLLAVMTGSGEIDVDHPALVAGALVLTTAAGAKVLGRRLPAHSSLIVLPGTNAVDPRAAVEALWRLGHETILSEAGPRVFGSLLAARLVDEVFLTQSPLFAGRAAGAARLGLIEDTALLPDLRLQGRLGSLRLHSQHLFLQYRLTAPDHPRNDIAAVPAARKASHG